MKKIFTLLCVAFCATSLYANVVTGTCGDNLQWAYDTDTKALTITGSGDMWNYYFYVEADGNAYSEEGKRMMKELAPYCDKLRIIGSFPHEKKL